jgi:hypothetical protein
MLAKKVGALNLKLIECFFSRSILGCDFQTLSGGDCANQCIKHSDNKQVQASCQVGCTFSSTSTDEVKSEKPIVAVDPVPVRSIDIH